MTPAEIDAQTRAAEAAREPVVVDENARTALQVNQHVGRRLRIRRELMRLGLRAFAPLINRTKSTVTRYELGETPMTACDLFEIARALRVPVQYFFDGLPDIPELPQHDDPLRRNEMVELINSYCKLDGQGRQIIDYLVKQLPKETSR